MARQTTQWLSTSLYIRYRAWTWKSIIWKWSFRWGIGWKDTINIESTQSIYSNNSKSQTTSRFARLQTDPKRATFWSPSVQFSICITSCCCFSMRGRCHASIQNRRDFIVQTIVDNFGMSKTRSDTMTPCSIHYYYHTVHMDEILILMTTIKNLCHVVITIYICYRLVFFVYILAITKKYGIETHALKSYLQIRHKNDKSNVLINSTREVD